MLDLYYYTCIRFAQALDLIQIKLKTRRAPNLKTNVQRNIRLASMRTLQAFKYQSVCFLVQGLSESNMREHLWTIRHSVN